MWKVPSTITQLNDLVRTWLLTLELSGCAAMLQAGLYYLSSNSMILSIVLFYFHNFMLLTGADGVLQSMMLSLGGLQFKNHHLEFRTHPKDLHRDYFWRRLNYGNQTHLNLSVIVGDDNKAQLHAALDRNDKPYYACDAGCLDPPLKLR